eukprot:snap_masked-scaffold_36-processed-gene-2.49-mRNA-1 protein AED:1.00 eAED:1.00 QI:0/-1/0/0/-1/1/1/0/129
MEKLHLNILERDLGKRKEHELYSCVEELNVKEKAEEDQGLSAQNVSTNLPASLKYSAPQISPQKRKETLEMKLFRNSRWLEMLEAKYKDTSSSEEVKLRKRKDRFSYPESQRKKRRLVRRNAASEHELH